MEFGLGIVDSPVIICPVKDMATAQLYTFVDTSYLGRRNPIEVARALCAGGSDLIQLRAKNVSRDEILQLARDILPVTRAAEIPLVINDHPDIAREIGAEFVHLGQEDFFEAGHANASAVRSNTRLGVGLSSHAPDQAQRAVSAGADYVAVGPVFATATKPGRPPVTLEYVRWAAANLRVPWFAIGGITIENIDAVLAAGARRICVVSAILNAPDIAEACQQFRKRLLSAPIAP